MYWGSSDEMRDELSVGAQLSIDDHGMVNILQNFKKIFLRTELKMLLILVYVLSVWRNIGTIWVI